MKTKEKYGYEAPLVQVFVVRTERRICLLSGNSGTETVGEGGGSYDDSDFE